MQTLLLSLALVGLLGLGVGIFVAVYKVLNYIFSGPQSWVVFPSFKQMEQMAPPVMSNCANPPELNIPARTSVELDRSTS